MATKGYHGVPGSYKTSSAVWYDLVPALRAGRLVVTNVEGMRPKAEIEKALNEKFPESADLWRISSQTEAGLNLWRYFYCWMPCGAFVLMDEIQQIYPADRSFKATDYNYKPIEVFTQLKDYMIERYYKDIGRQGNETESADIDDLGEIIYNEDGTIIYPTTMLDAFMRHRKYNWDILWCTPDILQVLMLIRGATEKAFHYSQKDVLKLAARRPRVREHLAKENGLTHKKGNPIKFLKVPIDVHKLYKSTAAGQVTKSGVGDSPFKAFKWPFIFFIVLLIGMALYNLFLSGSDTAEQASKTTHQDDKQGIEIVQSGTVKSAGVASHSNSVKTDPKAGIDVALPYRAKEIYLVGAERVTQNGEFKEWLLYFELTTKVGILTLSGKDLRHYGINARYVTECFSNLIWQGKIYSVYCRPDKKNEQKEEAKAGSFSLFG